MPADDGAGGRAPALPQAEERPGCRAASPAQAPSVGGAAESECLVGSDRSPGTLCRAGLHPGGGETPGLPPDTRVEGIALRGRRQSHTSAGGPRGAAGVGAACSVSLGAGGQPVAADPGGGGGAGVAAGAGPPAHRGSACRRRP